MICACVAELASGEVDSQMEKFSPAALDKLASTCVGLPIAVNFDYSRPFIGRVVTAANTDNRVMALVDIDAHYLDAMRYLAPGLMVLKDHTEGNVRCIDDLGCVGVSIVDEHADKTISPMHPTILSRVKLWVYRHFGKE